MSRSLLCWPPPLLGNKASLMAAAAGERSVGRSVGRSARGTCNCSIISAYQWLSLARSFAFARRPAAARSSSGRDARDAHARI